MADNGASSEKHINPIGVASAVFGVLAIVFSWVPVLAPHCRKSALMGLILGACGLLYKAIDTRQSIVTPLLGLALTGVSLLWAFGLIKQ